MKTTNAPLLLRAVVAIGLSVLLVASLALAAARIIPWLAFWIVAALCFLASWLLKKYAPPR